MNKTTVIIDSSQRDTLDVSNSKWTYKPQSPFLNVKSINLIGLAIFDMIIFYRIQKIL